MSYLITTRDPLRRRDWRRIFDTDHLPVLCAQPRYQEVQGKGTRLAYDLDLSAFHPFARRRLAAHVARRTRQPYGVVWAEVKTAVSWPIDAVNCETAVPDRERPFLVPRLNNQYAWMTLA